MNFEAFGSSPEFTTPIQQFLFNNCSKIEEAKKVESKVLTIIFYLNNIQN